MEADVAEALAVREAEQDRIERRIEVKEQEGNTFIGFKINYSPDAHKLEDFIKHLESLVKDDLPDIV